MKGANRYEKFKTQVIERSSIQEAYYNPRTIDDAAQAKLKKFIKSKEGGLLSTLTWNQTSGNLVSGHQRLSILDALHRGKPYKLTVSVVEMEEDAEVKANIFMNNPSAQGEWDVDKLKEIHEMMPDLDFEADLGFEREDLDLYGLIDDDELFGDDDYSDAGASSETSQQDYRDIKKDAREKAKQENADGDGKQWNAANFTLTFIFPDSDTKAAFMDKIGQRPTESRLNSQILLDLLGK